MKFHGVEGKWFSPVLLNWRFLLNFVLKPLRLDKKFFIFSIFKDAYLERIYGKRKTNAIGADAWFDNLWLHCIRWAEQIGQHTAAIVRIFLSAHKVEQQGYKSCMALLKLADRYAPHRRTAACARPLRISRSLGP